jgi:hypothetical protein
MKYDYRNVRYFGLGAVVVGIFCIAFAISLLATGSREGGLYIWVGLLWLGIGSLATCTSTVLKGCGDRLNQLESRLASLSQPKPEA